MFDKDPTTWTLGTWAIALGMALGGGLMKYYAKFKHTRHFSFIQLIGEVGSSAIVGLGTFMALAAIGCPIGLCAAAAGIGGHMGTKLVVLIEQVVVKRIEKKAQELDNEAD